MDPALRRLQIWAPVAKAAALFLLPFPLLLAAIVALATGEPTKLALIASALGCVWGAGVLSWRALAAEARYQLGERAELPRIPQKLVATLLTSAGAAGAATAAGHAPGAAAAFAAVGAAGYLSFYGRDLRPERITVLPMPGVDVEDVRLQLEQAHQRLRRIEAAARDVSVPEFCDRLGRIIGVGRGILVEIERDPSHAARARRFLHLYLDSTERVTQEYARTHRKVANQSLEQNFRQLLIDMEQAFERQHRKLLEHEALTLDVEIEVLDARLAREGIPDHLEARP